MTKSFITAFALCATMAATGMLQAQDLKSAYFLEGYYYRHLMNPAFRAERAFLSMPGLGNMDISANGNVGVSDFLYPYDDASGRSILTTFMNRNVDEREFLKNLNTRNKLSANVDVTLLSCGFKAWGGSNTIGIGFHSRSHANAPYELFEFMKSSDLGVGGKREYCIEDVRFNGSSYADISFNHARPVNDRLTVGATLKVLAGFANMDARFHDMRIATGEQEWLINANGYVHASARNASFGTLEDGEINKFRFGDPDLNGLGAAIDLGAVYTPIPYLTLSAAVTDIGFIRWRNTLKGHTSNEPYAFNGFETIGVGSDSNYPTLDEQLDNLSVDFEDMVKVYDGGTISKTTNLGATLNVGAEYAIPAWSKLSFGVLSSTHIYSTHTWTEGRASVNLAPVKWFEATLSGAWSTYGPGFGFVINFHPKGFNFFVGSDFMLTQITPQYVPVNNLNANFCMGINFGWGDIL